MEKSILGIHHITAVVSDPQRTVDFYGGVLGLALVKQTINFDDPSTYHFYFGNRTGQPGTLLTFFPWPGASRGRTGAGQATTFSLCIPKSSVGYWRERLKSYITDADRPEWGFEPDVVALTDPDGLSIHLVAHESGTQDGEPIAGVVPQEHAIFGVHSAAITVEGYERTAALLTETLGFHPTLGQGSRHRFEVGPGGAGTLLDVLCLPDAPAGAPGTGTLHHVAWRTSSEAEQAAWQWKIAHAGLNVTPIIDRQYFQSIYFREPGGVLFEIATDPPGFAVDEPADSLGTRLCLPPQYEQSRQKIEAFLPPIRLPARPNGA